MKERIFSDEFIEKAKYDPVLASILSPTCTGTIHYVLEHIALLLVESMKREVGLRMERETDWSNYISEQITKYQEMIKNSKQP